MFGLDIDLEQIAAGIAAGMALLAAVQRLIRVLRRKRNGDAEPPGRFVGPVCLLLAVVLAVAACGTMPVARRVFVETPDSCPVYFDGLYMGRGPLTLCVLEDLPNLLEFGSPCWLRMVLVSCPELDTLAVR